jgi:hypothetical protein
LIATLFAVRPSQAPRLSRQPPPADAIETRWLRERVAQLEATIARGLPALPPVDESLDIATLVARARALDEDEEATLKEMQAADDAIFALVARDPSVHAALARLFRDADERQAEFLLRYLVHNPFVHFTTDGAVTAEIAAIARELLADPERPHLRAAGAMLLLSYAGATPESVRMTLTALGAERDAATRDRLLEVVSEKALGVELTEVEAAPLVAELRMRMGQGDTGWASALADWSDAEEDYRWMEALLAAQTEGRKRQECLNAFRREARLVEGRVERARALLCRVMLDPSLDANSRELARHLLAGYAPWDTETADAVRRFEGG